MSLKTVIVDDELLARQIIEEYVAKIETLKLVLNTGNSIEFVNFIQQNEVDLVFLDIEMPEINGIEILRSMVSQPKIILTTAYSEYALESYEYDVVDYLLKPIKFERFLRAVNKVSNTNLAEQTKEATIKELQIKHDGLLVNIPLDTIQYIQSFGNYLRIYTDTRMYLITETLTNMISNLPNNFQRTHKSYIANISRVKKATNSYLLIENIKVPLSSMYKIIVRKILSEIQL